MNRLGRNFSFRLSANALRTCGMVFLLAGVFGNLIQRKMLGVGDIANSQLLQMMQENPSIMQMATTALVFQVLEVCAVPIFAFLLVEGTIHTSSFHKYFLRVFVLAVVCQLLYRMSMSGLNPVFALVMSMVMLYFFRRFPEKKAGHIAIKAIAIIGTFLWSNILGIENGAACVIITAVLWALREKPYFRAFGGCMATICCCFLSFLYVFAALSFLLIYFYNGERGPGSKRMNYLYYPGILLISGMMILVL